MGMWIMAEQYLKAITTYWLGGGKIMVFLAIISIVIYSTLFYVRSLLQKKLIKNEDEIKLKSSLLLLSVLISSAPLLGLLGTVIGMIDTFQEISQGTSVSKGSSYGNLADGISQALITTQVGLSIAIPALVCLVLLQQQKKHLNKAKTNEH